MSIVRKILLGTTLTITAIASLLVFVCPYSGMNAVHQDADGSQVSSLCQMTSVDQLSGGMINCLSAHLGLANAFSGMILATTKLLVMVLGLWLIFWVAQKFFLSGQTLVGLSPLLSWSKRQADTIRARYEQKMRAWFLYIGNCTIASAV